MAAAGTCPDKDELAAPLARMGLIAPGDGFTATRLGGGVSCDVWKIERPGRGGAQSDKGQSALVIKRALAKLRVTADWHAPPARWKAEVAWLELAARIDPATAPPILGVDETASMFAMAFLEGLPLWKSELAAGRADAPFAATTGRKLAVIHAATAGRPDIARQFDNGAQFHALRLDPYLLFTAGRHPDIAADIREVAADIAQARIALMQGDISPKNILIGFDDPPFPSHAPERATGIPPASGLAPARGERGPVFLDAETACYGDPVFDLAFCINHLLLKCVWHPEYSQTYLDSYRALIGAYLAGVTWEDPAGVEKRAAKLLAMLLLARIDGKSPAEYLIDPKDQAFVRDTAKDFIYGEEESLETMALIWETRIAAREAS